MSHLKPAPFLPTACLCLSFLLTAFLFHHSLLFVSHPSIQMLDFSLLVGSFFYSTFAFLVTVGTYTYKKQQAPSSFINFVMTFVLMDIVLMVIMVRWSAPKLLDMSLSSLHSEFSTTTLLVAAALVVIRFYITSLCASLASPDAVIAIPASSLSTSKSNQP
jgi:uncharacterized membrane protein